MHRIPKKKLKKLKKRGRVTVLRRPPPDPLLLRYEPMTYWPLVMSKRLPSMDDQEIRCK